MPESKKERKIHMNYSDGEGSSVFEKVLENFFFLLFQRYKKIRLVLHTSTKINGIKRNDSLPPLLPLRVQNWPRKEALPYATREAKNDPISAQMAIFMALK